MSHWFLENLIHFIWYATYQHTIKNVLVLPIVEKIHTAKFKKQKVLEKIHSTKQVLNPKMWRILSTFISYDNYHLTENTGEISKNTQKLFKIFKKHSEATNFLMGYLLFLFIK